MNLNNEDAIKTAEFTTEQWRDNLKNCGYDHQCQNLRDYKSAAHLSRVIKKCINHTKLKPGSRVLEIGCGGGVHLVKFFLNGFHADGIDSSPEVVERCNHYIEQVRKFERIETNISVHCSDVFKYSVDSTYDLSYHFGVVEHFINRSDRMKIWNILYNSLKPGAWVMSVVPSGSHLLRSYIKKNGLCGYNIEEIDYSILNHESEFIDAGFIDVYAYPWNFFGFLPDLMPNRPLRSVANVFQKGANILIPNIRPFRRVSELYAHSLLVFGRRPTHA
jgi:SAM-dependent methyltransferase